VDVEISDLTAFLALVDTGHYGRAAASVHLTRSGLSRAVSRLEAAVGEELVRRDAAGTHGLTPAGESFATSAAAIVSTVVAAVDDARHAAGTRLVRVGTPGVVDGPPMPLWPRLTSLLRSTEPRIELRFVPLPFASMWHGLRDGVVDLIINSVSSPDPRTVSTPVAAYHRVGLVGDHHELAEVDSLTAAEFADHLLLANPDLPAAWMHLYVLGDVRGVADARLELLPDQSMSTVLRRVSDGDCAVVTQADYGVVPGPYHLVQLPDAPPGWHHVDRRRDDRRPEVRIVADAIGALLSRAG
jgi:DNA-binding transcriptional LysR family regulator